MANLLKATIEIANKMSTPLVSKFQYYPLKLYFIP